MGGPRHLINSVLSLIGGAGLTVNPKKCCWGGRAVEFLGHFIGEGNMTIPEHRTTALANYTRPTTKRDLRAFLGSVGFYRRYLPRLADRTSLLTPKTSNKAPQKVEWSGEEEGAFCKICDFFCQPSTLRVPLVDDMLSIVSDASGRGIGGILQVRREDGWWPAAYFSRQLRGAEHRYSATELEALALTETIRHFSYHLYGRQFQAYTDHKPLEQLTTSTRLNPRLSRLAFKLQEWLVDIVYLPGDQNTLADALSREERATPTNTDNHSSENSISEEGPCSGSSSCVGGCGGMWGKHPHTEDRPQAGSRPKGWNAHEQFSLVRTSQNQFSVSRPVGPGSSQTIALFFVSRFGFM